MSKRGKHEGVSKPDEINTRYAPAVVSVNNPALAKLLNVKLSDKIPVMCKNGVPLSREWRNRFRDSKIDKCITISQNIGKPKESSEGGE